jgi:apolipoprotein N-acyltransferase
MTNSIYVVTREGIGSYRYDKQRLVPGMERTPFLPAGRLGSDRGSLAAGPPTPPWEDGRYAYGPLICYESLFSDLSRAHRRAGADVLINLTSDVWFRGLGGALADYGLSQHAAHMVLRAVENRAAVARAANGGLSFVLSPRGERIGSGLPPEGGLQLADVPVSAASTFFGRHGDLAGPVSAITSLLLLLWGVREQSRKRDVRLN